MKKIKLLELFSGIGCQTQALKNIGIEHISTQCEIDKYAINIYNQLHGDTENLGDISKVDENTLSEGQWDLITYSFPCFTGDTLVMTTNGYKQIKDIQIGDNVITHTRSFKEVINVFNNGLKDIIKIKGMGVDEIKCTPNHRFYVREKKYRWEHKGRVSKEGWKKKDKIRYLDEPKWIEAKDLTKNHFFGIPINTNEIIPEWDGIDLEWSDGRKTRHKNELSKYMDNNDFWWLIGRYLGDGWCRTNGGIIICTAHNEVEEVTQVLDRLGLHYNKVFDRTATKIHIPIKEIGLFCLQFGKGALNKHLTGMIFDLPTVLLKSFLDGYLSADGHYLQTKCGKVHTASSISRELIYGISMCIMKVYHNPVCLYKTNRPSQCIIEGRIVNQHNGYQIRFNEYKSSSDKAFYEGGYIWVPFKNREDFGKDIVYDIEVDTDHSFTANNVIVHNCTNISVAGQQEGANKGSGTASSLLWECEKIIRKVKPTYLLMENVKNLLSKKHIHNFEEWLKILEGMGYTNYYKVLNAKDFGVPQNRERVFCVSILGEHEPYVFPEPRQLNIRLKDILVPFVDDKYYLSEKVQQRFKYKPQGQSIIGTTAPETRTIGQRDIVYNTENTMGALVATDYKQPKQIIEFDMPNGKKAEISDNVNEPNCFKEVRTEQGKLGRKLGRQQGLGDTTPRNKDSKMFITKNDGVANCLTTTCGVEQIIVEPTKTLELKKGTIAFIPNGNGNYYHYVFEKDIVINLDGPMFLWVPNGEPTRLNDDKELSRNHKEGYRVYDSNGLSATIKANGGGLGDCSSLYMIDEPVIVASRGRYTDKDDATKTEQQLEVNDSGLTNTITTVQKDNYVAEPKLIVHNNDFDESITTFSSNEKIICEQRCDEGLRFFKNNICGTLRTTNACGDKRILENDYKIRKLTPRECYRLMGWKDEQFDKIHGISDAQLYKTAGNGIVVNVLEAIFEKMFK